MHPFHRYILIVLLASAPAVLLLSPRPVPATEQFAATTGMECGACHVDPLGGGTLTEFGRGYLLSREPEHAPGERESFLQYSLLLSVRYLHIITAFLWFGTILYVHMVLKPAYASQGLPRGEVRVGFASMAVMAATGAVLTLHRVPSLSSFTASRFGVLLLIKIILFTVMVLSALFVVLLIGPRLKQRKPPPAAAGKDSYTVSELAAFDGEEGRPAYIAYAGKVYDVSGSNLWQEGMHMQRHRAGADLTEMLDQAPHGEDKVTAMTAVAELAADRQEKGGLTPTGIFYAMAYMNLAFVFIITFILALWG